MKTFVLLLNILSPLVCDEIALIDWKDIKRSVSHLINSCDQTCDNDDRSCSCDQRCLELGNCCVDYYDTDPELVSGNLVSTGHMTCSDVPVSAFQSSRHVYMVTTCPDTYHDPRVAIQCARSVSYDQYTYIHDLPVVGVETKRIYRYGLGNHIIVQRE